MMADTQILYYSYTGHTRALAEQLAKACGAALYQVEDAAPVGKLGAYVVGCFHAMRLKPGKIKPITADLKSPDTFILMAPIWNGHPAPPFYNMVEALPAGKKAEVWVCSASGGSRAKEKVQKLLAEKGCEMLCYRDIGPDFSLAEEGPKE